MLLVPADVRHLDVAVWLQTTRLNGVIVDVVAANEPGPSRLRIRAWNQLHRSSIHELYETSERQLLDGQTAESRLFIGGTVASGSVGQPLMIVTDMQPLKSLNFSDTLETRWSIVGSEWSFGRLLAERLAMPASGRVFKWSCILYENRTYTSSITGALERPFRLRSKALLLQPTLAASCDAVVPVENICDAWSVDHFVPNNHVLLLSDTLSDAGSPSERYAVYPYDTETVKDLEKTKKLY